MAVWIFAMTAAAQQATDKPSPVPRKPVRPAFAPTRAEKSGHHHRATQEQTRRTPHGNLSRTVRAPVPTIRRKPASLASFLLARTAG